MKFTELSPESQEVALKAFRSALYEGEFYSQDLPNWAIDDCALLEPADEEMQELFGPDYYSENKGNFMFKNNRKGIVFNTDAPYGHLECSEALEVTSDTLFFKWLGIDGFGDFERMISYRITSDRTRYPDTIIEFEIDDPDDLIPDSELAKISNSFKAAEIKFERHLKEILKRISSAIDSGYDEPYMREWLELNDYPSFDVTGDLYKPAEKYSTL